MPSLSPRVLCDSDVQRRIGNKTRSFKRILLNGCQRPSKFDTTRSAVDAAEPDPALLERTTVR